MLRQQYPHLHKSGLSADCEFAVSSISHARRMAGKRAATAAIRGRIEWPVWAVNYIALQSTAMLQDGEFSLRIRSFLRFEMVNGFAA